MASLESKIKEFLKIGSGSGSGDGSGYGSGSGSGYGYGSGSGDGDGDGIKSFNGIKLYNVDDVQTAITSIRGNVAKGFTINKDLNIEKCYILKQNNLFAHGSTLAEATQALQDKLFDDMDEKERINLFLSEFNLIDKYPAKTFYNWHNRLTGSCEFGRKQFASDQNIDLEKDILTVAEFIALTKNSYGKEIILKLKEVIKESR